jgi:hypothetical protein
VVECRTPCESTWGIPSLDILITHLPSIFSRQVTTLVTKPLWPLNAHSNLSVVADNCVTRLGGDAWLQWVLPQPCPCSAWSPTTWNLDWVSPCLNDPSWCQREIAAWCTLAAPCTSSSLPHWVHQYSPWSRFSCQCRTVITCKNWKISCGTRSFPSGVTKSVLTLFSVEHTNALDHTIVGNPLVEPPSTGRSNCLGGGLTALDKRHVENLDSLLREGPRREQYA